MFNLERSFVLRTQIPGPKYQDQAVAILYLTLLCLNHWKGRAGRQRLYPRRLLNRRIFKIFRPNFSVTIFFHRNPFVFIRYRTRNFSLQFSRHSFFHRPFFFTRLRNLNFSLQFFRYNFFHRRLSIFNRFPIQKILPQSSLFNRHPFFYPFSGS